MINSLCAKNNNAVLDRAVQYTHLPTLLVDKTTYFQLRANMSRKLFSSCLCFVVGAVVSLYLTIWSLLDSLAD